MIYRIHLFIKKLTLRSRIKYLKRRFYYLGGNVKIDIDSIFINENGICLADNCVIFKGVYLKSRVENRIGIKIGENVRIHEYTYIDDYGGDIVIEDNVGIGHHCILAGHGGLYIGKNSMIGGLTYIISSNHSFEKSGIPYIQQPISKKGIYIGSNVWIGGGCIILDGVSIGNNAVIGAGSVVTKNIPSNVLAMGNPAYIKRTIPQK